MQVEPSRGTVGWRARLGNGTVRLWRIAVKEWYFLKLGDALKALTVRAPGSAAIVEEAKPPAKPWEWCEGIEGFEVNSWCVPMQDYTRA